ncbi:MULTISPECIES: ribonuclease III [Arcicella]|uniref:Ribonuclease 3 n=4 Tax=Arcicella TaxID=217140 RepID=A0A841EEE3_9BACT|nr:MULTISPECIES: ribonuclease III [Arcicella]MBB6001592.1 ribonuclease-3 [Arcicella rosea]MDR6560485.1 ribonuclease-3 [Arcicella sp. BE51]MDR6809909.1 ribonuclease-3 [Arcicella sp. BE140]MDR6821258.1 ribonuclease-3 [Arcicella sp. BE139]MEA5256581.1 ribonuclease III [Arcicella aquatica]|eukprot:Opistho-1_new@72216
MLSPIIDFFSSDPKDKKLKNAVEHIIGENPSNLMLYRLAFMHSSVSKETIAKGYKDSNERLEFLGDSVLGMITAEYLFKKFPFKDEGFLTEIRSRMVSRESLNVVARKIGLDRLVEYDGNRKTVLTRTSMYGDALEALIGAIYLDKGFRFTRSFIIKKILTQHFDIETVVQNNPNFKSIVIEWAQREGKPIRFEIIEEGSKHNKEFTATIFVNEEAFSIGQGYSKKKAEQTAAMKACEKLEIS